MGSPRPLRRKLKPAVQLWPDRIKRDMGTIMFYQRRKSRTAVSMEVGHETRIIDGGYCIDAPVDRCKVDEGAREPNWDAMEGEAQPDEGLCRACDRSGATGAPVVCTAREGCVAMSNPMPLSIGYDLASQEDSGGLIIASQAERFMELLHREPTILRNLSIIPEGYTATMRLRRNFAPGVLYADLEGHGDFSFIGNVSNLQIEPICQSCNRLQDSMECTRGEHCPYVGTSAQASPVQPGEQAQEPDDDPSPL